MSLFDISLSTIDRSSTNEYFHTTLESLKSNSSAAHTVNLVVGNPDVEYLKMLESDSSYNIVSITEEEWALVKAKGKCNKFNLNFYRCLTQQVTKGEVGRLYLEDDVVFRKNWDVTIEEIVTGLKQEYPEFALSIYTPYNLSHHSVEIVRFDKGFYGTQGVFFTNGVTAAFAEKIMNEGILSYRHMADILLQEFCVEKDIPLFVLKNSLVQHIGEESSIHGNKFHKSVSFDKE